MYVFPQRAPRRRGQGFHAQQQRQGPGRSGAASEAEGESAELGRQGPRDPSLPTAIPARAAHVLVLECKRLEPKTLIYSWRPRLSGLLILELGPGGEFGVFVFFLFK